jgi:hypothetical protein
MVTVHGTSESVEACAGRGDPESSVAATHGRDNPLISASSIPGVSFRYPCISSACYPLIRSLLILRVSGGTYEGLSDSGVENLHVVGTLDLRVHD